MKPILSMLSSLILVAGCGCGSTGTGGEPDSATDSGPHDPLVADGPCGPCDDGIACTMDLCNSETLACVFLPLDLDLDGHVPTECGGDDCDDSRADVFAGAREVCLDGVDQDCDGIVDGPVAMGPSIPITATGMPSHSPSMVWTGSEHVVVWAEEGSPTELHLARLDGEGRTVGETRSVAGGAGSRPRCPDLIWMEEDLAVAWGESSAIGFVRLTPEGDEASTPREVAGDGCPALAWTGSRVGMGWSELDSKRFALLDGDGALVRGPVVFADYYRLLGWTRPGLAWTGSEFGIAWVTYDPEGDPAPADLYFARVAGSGEALEPPSMLTDWGMSLYPRVRWSGSEYALTWAFNASAIYFERLSPGGDELSGQLRISAEHAHVDKPDGAWTGSSYGLAWQAGRYGDRTVGFALLDPTGARLGEDLHLFTERHPVGGPVLDWTGSEFGVAWPDARDDPDCMPVFWDAPDDCDFEIHFNRIGLCE